MRLLVSSFERTACSSMDAQPFGRYFQLAANALRSKFIVHRPAELIGNEIADHGRAKSRGIGHSQRWAAGLPPLEHQLATRAAVRLHTPANHHPAMAVGQRTVLGGVGGQLMQNDRHRLGGFCGNVDTRAFYNRTVVLSAKGQLTANELTKIYTLPTALAQQGVRIRQ